MTKTITKFPKRYFETQAWANKTYTLGIDEAGRGCLAGPVVVGAAIIPIDTHQPLLKDSKVMSKEERDEAFAWITKHCIWTTTLADHHTIDTFNIYQTTLQLMKRAYLQIMEQLPFDKQLLKYVLIDAMPLELEPALKHPGLELYHFNYGESLSPSIAAASIVAKVTRDRIMEELHQVFPAYNFAKHKGYGTKEHIAALAEHGPCLIHRNTFIKNFVHNDDKSEQTSLFC